MRGGKISDNELVVTRIVRIIEKGGVIDSDLLAYMMGHKNTELRHGGNYDEFDPDYIRREHSKAEPLFDGHK